MRVLAGLRVETPSEKEDLGAVSGGREKMMYVKMGGKGLEEVGVQGGGDGTDTKTRQKS